jgi:hypothetical protein
MTLLPAATASSAYAQRLLNARVSHSHLFTRDVQTLAHYETMDRWMDTSLHGLLVLTRGGAAIN